MPNIILVRNTYPDAGALERVIAYVKKTALCGGYGIDPDFAYEQMLAVKKAYHTLQGVQLKHFFITFTNSEIGLLDFADILNLGFQTGMLFREYQMIYCIHLDSGHVHLHFVMNTTSFLDGHKYSDGLSMFNKLRYQLQEQFPKEPVCLYHTSSYDENNYYTVEKKGEYQLLEG